MSHRHAISDADWERIAPLLPCPPGKPGPVSGDNRLFVDTVLWIAKTGAPWRDLPERFGKWNSVYQRLNRGCRLDRGPECWRRWRTRTWSGWSSIPPRSARTNTPPVPPKTVPAVRRTKRWGTVGAGSGPRFTGRSAGWACR